MIFIFEVSNHFFNVIDMVIKTINIVQFFSSLCSRSIFSNNGALGYNFCVFCSIYKTEITINYFYMCIHTIICVFTH